MRTKVVALVLALVMAMAVPFAGLAQKAKTPAKKLTVKKPVAKKKVTTTKRKVAARKTTARSRRTVAKRAPAPANQRIPTKDRYAEIQQALADAGYFTGEPDGNWNQDSVEALKSFQDASGFEATGKIDSRSLIKLGLGPNYEKSATGSVPPTESTGETSGTRQPG